ncbi:MAG: hypothetical protein LBV19_06020 [Streptococcaceae bacterium]|jgi:VCBS repeat-containing protein|nr:hypothetical protein [Streptococcaceae bacterium]
MTLVNDNTNTTTAATSNINGTDVAYASGTIAADGSYTFSVSIQNPSVYFANEAAVYADIVAKLKQIRTAAIGQNKASSNSTQTTSESPSTADSK